MVFTPPPSPLPPRHPALPPSPSKLQESPPISIANDPIPKSKSRRRLLIILVPFALALVGSTSRFISSDSGAIAAPVLFSGNFRDHAIQAPHQASLESDRSIAQRLSRRRHRARSRLVVDDDPAPPHAPSDLIELDSRHDPVENPDAIGTATLSISGLPTPTQQFRAAGASTPPPVPTPAWPVPTPFPQPWDSSLSYNFSTTSCLAFFTTQLANTTFRACRSFGLLLGSSSDFFNIESNLTELTATLGGTCDTPQSADTCVGIMDWMAETISKPSVCGPDLAAKNSISVEALYGFRSYSMMRQAGCLIDSRTNSYCFAEAVGQTSPSDVYYYALPLGTPVPTSDTPSCSTCVQSLMAIYAQYATNTSLLVSSTYHSAAQMANSKCGPQYAVVVNSTQNNSAGRRFSVPTMGNPVWPFACGLTLAIFTAITILLGADTFPIP